jgi:micrococcal nuclease
MAVVTSLYCALAVLLFWGVCLLRYRRWRDMKFITVIDGDTFEAVDRKGKRRRLRLYGVDCPEMNQRNGLAAKMFVKSLADQKWVRVKLMERDRYRRHVADVRVEGSNLGYLLVKAGLAYPLTNSWKLRMAAAGARITRRGIHSGFGQAKPWNGFSRSWLGRLFHKKHKPKRRRAKR